MKFLKGFKEAVRVVNLGSNISEERLPNLQHVGNPLKSGNNISIFQQDWFEKLLPETLKVKSHPNLKKLNFDQSLSDVETENKVYILKKNDCTIDGDLVQFNYHQNTTEIPGQETIDGEPDLLEFDIHFVNNDKGIKLLVDITYGDNMAYEFSIETPNKINVIHYTGKGSLYDSETHWGFCQESILDLIKFFNAFNHGIKIKEADLKFLDADKDSYHHDIYNKKHLYNDDSDLLRYGNSAKLERFNNFIIKYL